jgi:murein DD-endopeptidase MepM/ murein hydrolase activator NlpD
MQFLKNDHKNIIKNIAAVSLSLCMFTSPVFSSAASYDQQISDKQENIDSLESEKTALENLVSQKQDELSSISSEIAKLESDKLAMMTTEEMAISELEFIKQSILDSEKEIESMEKQLGELEETLVQRARIMYQNSEINWLAVFFEADNIFDFFDRIEAYKQVAKEDADLLAQVKADKQQLELKKDQQERLFSEKEVLLAEIESAIEDIKNKKEITEGKYATLSNLLAEMEEEESRLDDEISTMTGELESLEEKKRREEEEKRRQEEERKKQEEDKKKQEEAIKNQQNSQQGNNTNVPSRGESNSNFCWPVASYFYVSSPFGYRTHPITHKWSMHTGVDLAASSGTAIYAAQSGVVEISTTNGGGYGYYIKIQHDNGMETLYAHCSKLLVSEGETVQRGQKIAEVGKTGAATGSHLHFEVIKNGEYVQPLDYVSDDVH